MGECPEGFLADDWLWSEYWTRYFTDRRPGYTWVVIDPDDGSVAGYLTGTPDAREFDRYVWRIVPGIVWRIIRKRLISRSAPRRALRAMFRSARRGELHLPKSIIREYPATWHFNLLPHARGQGLGSTLLGMFFETLHENGVAGVHAQVISANDASQATFRKLGMREVSSTEFTGFSHAIDGPLKLRTYVREL